MAGSPKGVQAFGLLRRAYLVRFDKGDIEFFKEFSGAMDDSQRPLVSKVLYGIFTSFRV